MRPATGHEGTNPFFMLEKSLPPASTTSSLWCCRWHRAAIHPEELLAEAHSEEESPWLTDAFFGGFLLLGLTA
jgi:hypothetical protein